MVPIKVCRIARDQHFDLFPPVLHPIFQCGHDRKSMLFKGSPGKTAFQQEGCDEQIQVPWGEHCKTIKRRAKRTAVTSQRTHANKPLDFGRIAFAVSPTTR